MKVTDLMDALSEEAYDAEMFALEIKHNGGDPADALLKHLEIDVVKLSPEFMRGLATEQQQQDRMNEVNRKLQDAGYKTIASSVEDASSLAILWNIGVNYIQGYFLQEPSSTITFDTEHEEQQLG